MWKKNVHLLIGKIWKIKRYGGADSPLVHCNIDRMVDKVLFVDTMPVRQVDIRLQPQQLRIDRSVYCSMVPAELAHNRRLHLLQPPSDEAIKK